eukprot:gene27055-30587_t
MSKQTQEIAMTPPSYPVAGVGRFAAGSDPVKRGQILDGAHRVFMKMGYDAASMNDVTREAGVSKGTIYVYFQSKEELFAALIERAKGLFTESVRELLSRHPDPEEGLRLFAHAFVDQPSGGVHLALVRGKWAPEDTVDVRVHEPLSVLDALEINRSLHSWSLDASLSHIAQLDRGVAVLLNCGETAHELLAQFDGTARPAQAPERGRMDLRSYGIGAQILRECGVQKMRLLGTPRRMPSMAAGYGLEIAGYLGAADKPLDGNSGKGLRIGIVQARFNADITDALASACLDEFAALGVAANDIHHVRVPGALEVPVALQALAELSDSVKARRAR